jgi:FKBP-type peptidyl-prolyl cis-trans isomerase (trigger factor)
MIEKIRAHDGNITEETAKSRIATHLVIYAIADKANIRPTEEEVQEEIARYGAGAMRDGNGPIDAKKIHGYIYEKVQQRKVYAHILGTQ